MNSCASDGVRMNCTEGRTESDDQRRKVRRTCDRKGRGRELKWPRRAGSVINVVNATSGWIGACSWGVDVLLGGVDGRMFWGGCEPVGDGNGDEGAAAEELI